MKSLCVKFLMIPILIVVSVRELMGQENLPSLIEEGVTNYPIIKAKLAEVERAHRDVSVAKAEYVPKLAVQHQYTYATSNSLQGSYYPNPAVISPAGSIRSDNINQAAWGSYTSLLLEWNVFNFGKVSGNTQVYRTLDDAARANYDNELLQHKVRIADAYLLTLMNLKLREIQSANLNRARAFIDAVSARVSAGMQAGTDSSLASAEFTRAKILFLQAKRDEQTQSLRLQEFIGRQSLDSLVVDSMSFLTSAPVRLDTGEWNPKSNPLLRYYGLISQASQARSIAVRRSFLPSLTLVGAAWARGSGISSDDTYRTDFSSGTKYQVYNYLLGISTRWTISDFVSNRQKYKKEYYNTIRDQEVYQEQDLRMRRQVSESELQYQISLEQAKAAPIQLNAAQQAYRQAAARYDSGLADLLTLMQSITTLNRAEADMAIAHMNVWRSLLAISAARGDFSIFMDAVGR